MIPVFKSKGVYGHIDGTDLCPPPSHPTHAAWVQIDYQILSWIHATISTDILQMIIQPATTFPTAPDSKWYIDSGADTHVSSTPGNLSHSSPYSGSEFIQVGNGQLLPVTHSGNTVLSLSSHSFKLNNVLVSPHLRKNLLSVRQFTKDINCSVEFDSSGFSVKDIHSKNVLLRCNSAEGLYSVSSSSQRHPTILSTAVVSPDVWHLRLGHPSSASVTQLVRRGLILSNNKVPSSISCHACQLGKHTRLPFSDSLSTTSTPFELIHSDVWTSPVMSFTAFLRFSAYVSTQFGARIKAFQCDNGREYDNADFATYFQTNGIHLRSSCPSTPQQNGKAERMNRTIINMEPRTFKQACNLPEWQRAMQEEFLALQRNHTWVLVSPPSGANIVGSKWVYRIKQRADGSIERYKARLVAQGYTQQPGIDYDETFSPVVKPVTIRTVLTLAISKSWPIHQLDVKNAFLNGYLSEPVYMSQPPGFVDPQYPDRVCLLQRALYGLKQAPRAWFQRFAAFLHSCGFVQAYSDCSMFLYRSNGMLAILLLYVDDIILTASTSSLLHRIISSLKQEFFMTDLGVINYFLGITASFNPDGLFLCQTKYIFDLLARTGMSDCNAAATPLSPRHKLAASDSPPYLDSTQYRSIVGALQYLTFTRPDIAFAVHQVCQYMHAPTENHFQAVKRILRYLKGSAHYGLQLFKGFSPSLHIYTDADWAGCLESRRSTSGYCLFFGKSLISWSSKKQNTVARSSAEAEYRAMANAVAEVVWVQQLLAELQVFLSSAPIVLCDNISAIYLGLNPIQHQRTKHIEIDIHFVRERVASRAILLQHVPSSLQCADIFTKALSSTAFCSQRSNLCVLHQPAQIAGG
ncbi:hypothetical protein SLEP1_g40416 [Rubroshorea leprosula]|uniref:Integrase catalytic domain-containing protein n=1 Tax=Rubroshorea leprosula TaxID=152421 RepID=A0AAV5L3D0_9ROSI|nr:hypothetical protein SLEP1_g40416 [Rubroshorea leprosula]